MGEIFDNPSDNFFSTYGKAVAAGQMFNDTLRKNAAFAALEKVYGPTAGDPELAAKLQANEHNAQLDPLLVQQQQLTNGGMAQTNTFNALAQPAKLAALAKGNTATDIANQTNQLGLDQATLADHVQKIHGALSGTLSTLSTQLQGVDDPNQRGALFDQQVQQMAPLLGSDPAALAQQLAPYRAQIVAQGAPAVAGLQQQIDAAIVAQLPPDAQQKLKLGQTNLDIADAKLAAAKAGGGGSPAQQRIIAEKRNGAAASIGSFDDNLVNLTTTIDEAIDYIKKNPTATGFVATGIGGLGAQKVSSSPAGVLAAKLDTIRANVGFNQLHDIKAQGGTLGSVSDSEEKLLQSVIASFDQGNGDQLIKNLERAKKQSTNTSIRLKKAFKSAYGDEAPDTSATGGADAPKQKYTYNAETGELE